jgi:hypothetical protein
MSHSAWYKISVRPEDQLVFIEPMSGMVIESPKETAAQTRAA